MADSDLEARLTAAEAKLELVADHLIPEESPPKPLWKRLLTLDTLKNLIYLVGFPAALLVAFDKLDKEFLNAAETRALGEKNTAIERLDQLQDINTDIYRLQSEGNDRSAFAIIEAKRGQIARLTDAVYTTWAEQPGMLGRYDLNALAEALLVQKRTDDALAVAQSVDATDLSPIDRIDQLILQARIQFENGPAHDMEAARDHLRAAMPIIPEVERVGQQLEMMEKITSVRLVNEYWRNSPCETLVPLAEGLGEISTELQAAGPYEDKWGVALTLQAVAQKCS